MRSGDLHGKNRQGGLFRTTHKVWNFSAEEEGLKKKSYSKEDSTPRKSGPSFLAFFPKAVKE